MKYKEYQPCECLKKFIDAYWILETDAIYRAVSRRFFVDCTTEILINMGTSTPYVNAITPLTPGNIYIGGSITRPNEVLSVPNSCFVGIRLKPGGISVFYNIPNNEIVDRVIEFQDKRLRSLMDLDDQLPVRLDKFFCSKINDNHSVGVRMAEIIAVHKGITSVDWIANNYNVSMRTLERIFNRNFGIPPKELISITRFDHVRKRIMRQGNTKESLSRIANDAGYFDHAHLTREFKKYSGLNPSEIKNWTAQPNHISLNL